MLKIHLRYRLLLFVFIFVVTITCFCVVMLTNNNSARGNSGFYEIGKIYRKKYYAGSKDLLGAVRDMRGAEKVYTFMALTIERDENEKYLRGKFDDFKERSLSEQEELIDSFVKGYYGE